MEINGSWTNIVKGEERNFVYINLNYMTTLGNVTIKYTGGCGLGESFVFYSLSLYTLHKTKQTGNN
jgi:hypothetical protein